MKEIPLSLASMHDGCAGLSSPERYGFSIAFILVSLLSWNGRSPGQTRDVEPSTGSAITAVSTVTFPREPWEKSGVCTFTPQASKAERAPLEPEDGRLYHGAQTMTFEPSGDPLAGYLTALNDPAIQPAVRGLFFSIPGTRGPANSLRELGRFFASADSIGFIPELGLFLVSDVATDSIIAVSTTYDPIIDSIITLAKGYGRRMFLRIGGEFNGAGPNWNGGGYHPYLYVTMFRKIVDMFAARGFRDSIATVWCYYPAAANDFDSVDAKGPRWYPGDAYVDWFGLDLFDAQDFDLSQPDSIRGSLTRKAKAERFLAMARTHGKPVYLNETSAARIDITPDSADGIRDWESWFEKFFAFIAAHPEIKGFNYINALWPERAYPGWGDARIQNNALIRKRYTEELRNPKYIHLPVTGTSFAEPPSEVSRTIAGLLNIPNPFREKTAVSFRLSTRTSLFIAVYDMLGRIVRVLHEGALDAGGHSFSWDGRTDEGIPARTGAYVCLVRWAGGVETRKILLLH
ncbi:MAG: FlgD immunoglobulin-like domain containing protein [Bacteroidota bacterium]|nr:FlgD immunoglobulin-like domain containing protein [Bacteroidota bacterium]